GRGWYAANYGPALAVATLSLFFPRLIPAPTRHQQVFVYLVVLYGYASLMIALLLRQMSRVVRRGAWWPAGPTFVARRADIVVFAGGLVGVALFLLVLLMTGGDSLRPSVERVLLTVLVSWTFAVPLAVRILGGVIRGVALPGAILGVVAIVYFGGPILAAQAPAPWVGRLVDLGAVAALVALVGPGQAWLRATIDRLVFRRSRRHRAELQAVLHGLSPELGPLD